MPVTRDTGMQQADMDALAALANSKTSLQDRPYDFTTGPWLSEFWRLRINLFSQFFQWPYHIEDEAVPYFSFPYKPSALISGPWSITPNDNNGDGILRTATIDIPVNEVGNDTGKHIMGQPPTVKDNQFVFCRGFGQVATEVFLSGLDMLPSGPEYKEFYPLFPGTDLYTRNITAAQLFKFKVSIPSSPFTLEFSFNWTAKSDDAISTYQLFGANASDCTLTINNLGFGNFTGSVTCTKEFTGDFTFEVGIRDSTEGSTKKVQFIHKSFVTFGGVPVAIGQVAIIRNTVTESPVFPVLDNQTAGYVLTPPSMGDIEVIHPDTDDTKIFDQNSFRCVGNVARITHTPSGGGSGFSRQGIWIARTSPIQRAWFYQADSRFDGPSHNRSLNPFAKLPTVGTNGGSLYPGIPDQPEIWPSPNACEFTLPSYEVAKYGDGNYNFSLAGIDLSGAIIRDVFIRRLPVQNDQGVWVEPTSRPALTVRLGTVISGIFLPYETFTIPEGQMEIWPDFFCVVNSLFSDQGNQFKLVYECSQRLNVQCAITSSMQARGGFVGGNASQADPSCVGVITDFPMLPDHYNDVETLLNLI